MSTAPLRPEYGGDGRTEADAMRGGSSGSWTGGHTVIYDPVEPDPLTTMTSIVPKPKRKASLTAPRIPSVKIQSA